MATTGTLYVQGGSVPGWAWLAACGIGLIACSLLMVNNLRDIGTDPLHGKRTLAVRLGERGARAAFCAMLAVPIPLGVIALWWARSAEFVEQNPIIHTLRWFRTVGDVVFILGAVAFGVQIVKGLLHRAGGDSPAGKTETPAAAASTASQS